MSAWPACRPVSSIMCARIQRIENGRAVPARSGGHVVGPAGRDHRPAAIDLGPVEVEDDLGLVVGLDPPVGVGIVVGERERDLEPG